MKTSVMSTPVMSMLAVRTPVMISDLFENIYNEELQEHAPDTHEHTLG